MHSMVGTAKKKSLGVNNAATISRVKVVGSSPGPSLATGSWTWQQCQI